MKLVSIEIIEVVVPANPGTVNSVGLNIPLHKLVSGADAAWTKQFDEFSKFMLIGTTDEGIIGFGESLRDTSLEVTKAMARQLIGVDLTKLAWQALPLVKNREYDGFELLVLDLLGKRTGVSVSSLIGGALRSEVNVGAWTSHRFAEDAGKVAQAAQERGATSLKLKCDVHDDVGGIAQSVLDACGPSFGLIFDPNERFVELRHAVKIAKDLEKVGNVICLEDPLPRWDLGSYAELRARTTVPIAVHVALGYIAHGQRISDVLTAITMRATDVFNLSSGIGDFIRMAHIADAAQRPYWHGSEVDLGIMEAGYVHVTAASHGGTLPSDIFGRHIRSSDLLIKGLELNGATVKVPTGPGLGVELDLDAVDRHAISHSTVSEEVKDYG